MLMIKLTPPFMSKIIFKLFIYAFEDLDKLKHK